MAHDTHSRRQFNTGRVGASIVFAVSAAFSYAACCCGCASQALTEPAMVWMLGTAANRARVVALVAGLVSGGAALGVAAVRGGHAGYAAYAGVLVGVGGLFGAIPGTRLLRQLEHSAARRVGAALGTLVALMVLIRVSHVSGWSAQSARLASWSSAWAFIAVGAGGTAICTGLRWPAGFLHVVGLFLLTGLSQRDSVLASIAAMIAAGAIPAVVVLGGRLATGRGTAPMLSGGLIGGLAAGSTIAAAAYNRVWPIPVMCVLAMFLCAREVVAAIPAAEAPQNAASNDRGQDSV